MAELLDRFPDPVADRAIKAARQVTKRRERGETERVLDDVAGELGLNYRTIAAYVQNSDRYSARCAPSRGRPKLWTDARGHAAIRAWVDRHGRTPTYMDWAPAKLKARGHRNAGERIAAFQEGWTDADGRHWPFPHASSVPLTRWVREVPGQD
jgi:hypothetical protein